MSESARSVANALSPACRVLLMGHVDPDGDAAGSVLALGTTLRRLGKQVVMACPNQVPAKYAFLPGVHAITTAPQGPFDLFISLDASDTERLAGLYGLVKSSPDVPLINIDHHITNIRFGTLNWVAPEAGATSEIVVDLIDALGVSLDRELALPLLVGIVTDTRGFRTSSTTPKVLRTAGRLIEAGVPLAEVMERTMNTRPFAMMCLWGKMIETSRLEGRIVWSTLTAQAQTTCGVRDDDGDGGFVNYLATAGEADVGILFHDKGDGEIEVGFRSKPGVSIAQVALDLGGGGHPQAAGCTIRGELEPVRQQVLRAVRVAIAGQTAHYSEAR